MGCNAEHLTPNRIEQESRKLMILLQEVGLENGDIPRYGYPSAIHVHTEMLCAYCQEHDVTQHSLELQIWWRDHQKADRERKERELREEKEAVERKVALSKLSDREQELLGLKKRTD